MRLLFLLPLTLLMDACASLVGNLNVFPVQYDKDLGAQVARNIDSTNAATLLDSAQHVELYAYLYGIRDSILKTGQLEHSADFAWRLRILNDSTLNAFCTPGGYIYFYTGLMRYLESEDQLAGVMAHEMAHADKRHSTDALTRQYGTEILLTLALGGAQPSMLLQIAEGLTHLSYGRSAETESDLSSVDWLYKTAYNPTGAAGFFKKMLDSKAQEPPQFLSTHPNSDNRVEAMTEHWQSLGGKTGQTFEERYKAKLKLIP
ncbi:MAG: M48 family metalloprotease [Bacteroidetes bacterium]|nr:M48 family metalloprotease [Bacteroidota bacterium]MDA0943282.1 M48 family metalloprotease [Bacteroidota bacterium]MDA1111129.1 M48 family metalloprotease [Bacteroidota bacterium]